MGYDNNNRFGLWMNRDRKEETHSHLAGQGEANNQKHWVSAWFSKDIPDDDKKALQEILNRHNASSKRPFIDITIKLKVSGAGQAQDAINSEPAPADDDFSDDIPF